MRCGLKYYRRQTNAYKLFVRKRKRGEIQMSNSNNRNKTMVPEAKAAMNRFKMEAANEVGVQLNEGYNGELTSRQAGSIGGQMVKKMIKKYEQDLANGQ